MEVVQHHLIPAAGVGNGVLPRNINFLLRVLAYLPHQLPLGQQTAQHGRHGIGVFLDEKAVLSVGHVLGGAASGDQHAGKAAGRRLAHHKAVGVKGGGEQEQVGAAIPRPDDLPVIAGRQKEYLVAERQLLGVGPDGVAVGALAHEHHAEVPALVLQLLQGVQNDPQTLVPHHAAHEQQQRHALRQVKTLAHGADLLLRQPSGWEVHAVGHDDILPLIAQRAEVLSRAVADRPHLVTGGDVLHQQLDGGLLQPLAVDGVGDVDIEFGVIGE